MPVNLTASRQTPGALTRVPALKDEELHAPFGDEPSRPREPLK